MISEGSRDTDNWRNYAVNKLYFKAHKNRKPLFILLVYILFQIKHLWGEKLYLYTMYVRNETGIQQQVKNKMYLYNENQKLSPKNQPASIHRRREVHFHGVPNRDRLQPSRRGREAARRQ